MLVFTGVKIVVFFLQEIHHALFEENAAQPMKQGVEKT